MIKKYLFYLLLLFSVSSCTNPEKLMLFDGAGLNDWMPDNSGFSVQDSAIISNDQESFIFYNGKNHQFRNFEFSCDVQTQPGGVAEILFHTEKPAGNEIPKGYAVRIKNTYEGAGSGEGLKLTGSIDRIRNVYFPMVKDNQWFKLKIQVENKRIRVMIDTVLVQDYTEPSSPWRPEDLKNRLLTGGTVGIHSIKGKVAFKNLSLQETEEKETSSPVVDAEYDQKITELHAKNFPLIDFHVHLKDGLTINEVVDLSRAKGLNYGVAANCGLKFPVTNNSQLNNYLDSIQHAAIFKGMQAEGREWMTLFSPDTAARFDYIFTDAMTWTNRNGKRLRLWIKEETEVGDPRRFMEELVGKIEQILQEPIDIYVNPTYIPDEIAGRYDELWTDERMDRVVAALVKNNVAFEINSRYKLPSIEFIRKAKDAGVKFTFGSNNMVRADLQYDYCFKVLQEVGLTAADMWMPRKPGERKIQNMNP